MQLQVAIYIDVDGAAESPDGQVMEPAVIP